jgi:hypothetical protein
VIIGDRFIWLHLPKTGGTSASRLFTELGLPSVVADDQSLDSKHESIEARLPDWDYESDSRSVFITLRRLPQWLLSDWHHKRLKMGLDIPFEPVKSGLFYSLRLGGVWVAADYWLRYFRIERCSGVIRLEHLEEDVRREIVPLLPLQSAPLCFPKANENRYSRDLGSYFRSSDLRRIYENNPIWRQQEFSAYGSTTVKTSASTMAKLRGLFR